MNLEDFYKLEAIIASEYWKAKKTSTIPAIQEKLSESEQYLLEAIRTVRELAIHNGMIEEG